MRWCLRNREDRGPVRLDCPKGRGEQCIRRLEKLQGPNPTLTAMENHKKVLIRGGSWSNFSKSHSICRFREWTVRRQVWNMENRKKIAVGIGESWWWLDQSGGSRNHIHTHRDSHILTSSYRKWDHIYALCLVQTFLIYSFFFYLPITWSPAQTPLLTQPIANTRNQPDMQPFKFISIIRQGGLFFFLIIPFFTKIESYCLTLLCELPMALLTFLFGCFSYFEGTL